MNDPLIDQLITSRNAITNVTEDFINLDAVDYIDSILATVPPGQDNRVDLLLGRRNATLPQRADYGELTEWHDRREDWRHCQTLSL